jgi:hypothetical protein
MMVHWFRTTRSSVKSLAVVPATFRTVRTDEIYIQRKLITYNMALLGYACVKPVSLMSVIIRIVTMSSYASCADGAVSCSVSPSNGSSRMVPNLLKGYVTFYVCPRFLFPVNYQPEETINFRRVFLNRRAAARYRALASIIPDPRLIKKEFTGPRSHKG